MSNTVTPENHERDVWKVGSRWSNHGDAQSSILDIFLRHDVVFVGKDQKRFSQISPGDLIVVADAKTVVAMGICKSRPQPVTEMQVMFTSDDLHRFDFYDKVIGCRLTLISLPSEEQPHYRTGAFHHVNDRKEEFWQIYEKAVRNHDKQTAAKADVPQQDKNLDYLEQQIPSLSAAAVNVAYWQALASGQEVLVSDNGGIYQAFPDGTRKLIKTTLKPLSMPVGTRMCLP